MAASGFTPLSLYYSPTTGHVPTNTNLAYGELAINIFDGNLYYKDSSNVVQVIASKDAASGIFSNVTTNTLSVNTITSNVTFSSTGAITLPSGTTAQEPGTPAAGMIRYNSTTDSFEGYTTGKGWGTIGGGNYTDTGFWQNIQVISSNQAINVGYNASSVGPITISSGVTVTVPTGSTWLVL